MKVYFGNISNFAQLRLFIENLPVLLLGTRQGKIDVLNVEIDQRSIMACFVSIPLGQCAAASGSIIITRKKRHFLAVHRLSPKLKPEDLLVEGDSAVQVGHGNLEVENGVGHVGFPSL